VLLEKSWEACRRIHHQLPTIQKDCPERLSRVKALKAKLEAQAIPTIHHSLRFAASPPAKRVTDWEQSELSLPPFHAVLTPSGEPALNALMLACSAHSVIAVIDPYVLSDGQTKGLRKLVQFAEQNHVAHVTGYGAWSPREAGEDRIESLPPDRAEAFDRANSAFGRGSIHWEFKLYASTKNFRSKFHDRFLAFKSPKSKADRVVNIGRGVGAFHSSEDRTILARVDSKCWDDEVTAYGDKVPEACVLNIQKGDNVRSSSFAPATCAWITKQVAKSAVP
jgi:hypothetical protein